MSVTSPRQECSADIMKNLMKKNDHIYVYKEHKGQRISRQMLTDHAKRLRAEGHPGCKYADDTPDKPKYGR